MRILHALPSVKSVLGGASRAIIHIERALAAGGIEVYILTNNGGGVETRVQGIIIGMAPENITGGIDRLMGDRGGLFVRSIAARAGHEYILD